MDRVQLAKQVLSRLEAIADFPMSGRGRVPFLAADRVDQEALEEIQAKLADLMLDVANELPANGPGPTRLAEKYPYAFTR